MPIIPSDGISTYEGMRAFRNGAKFRRKAVSRTLLRLIARQDIPAFLLNKHGDTLPIKEEVRLFPNLDIDVRKSLIGMNEANNSYGWHAETDAQTLIHALENRCACRSKKSVNDWILFERIIRDIIEHSGLPETNDRIYAQAEEKLSATSASAHSPHLTEATQLISCLCTEYGKDALAKSEN